MPADARASISLLLVEDEQGNRTLLGNMLARKYPGLPLYRAGDGQAGLELFQTHRPAIVITDINMPVMSGIEMIELIRADRPETKFIVLTGDTGRLELEQAVGKGFNVDCFIVKPVNVKTLFAAIDNCISEISG